MSIDIRGEGKPKINICIPMAGRGSRFRKVGYSDPKPFIQVGSRPMIINVINNLKIHNRRCKFIMIVQEEHKPYLDKYKEAFPKDVEYEFIFIDRITEGAAETVLIAKDYINNDTPLLLANSDQMIDWYPQAFIEFAERWKPDGIIMTFHSTSAKWSYVQVDNEGYITYVKEKEPISNHATTGLYYFSKGSYYVYGAEDMMRRDIRTNGEFYVAPVYNQLIVPMNFKVLSYPIPVKSMHGLGTPEDLIQYVRWLNGE